MPGRSISRDLALALSYILIILTVSCDEGIDDNPYDPDGSDYIEPDTFIETGPGNGTVLSVDYLDITFSGNELVTEYSHRLDLDGAEGEWSEWSAEQSLTLLNLDEGSYTFLVMGRYSEQDQDPSPAEVSFTVDALGQNALRVFPRSSYAGVGETFAIDIYAEEIENIAGIALTLAYSAQSLELAGEIEKGAFLEAFTGTDIFIDTSEPGQVTVTIGITDNESGGALTGSGPLFSVPLSPLSAGLIPIDISSAIYIGQDNQEIALSGMASGTVLAE